MRLNPRAVLRRVRAERGMTLIELMVASSMMIVVAGATFAFLEAATRAQSRDQAYAQEITGTQAAMARLVHDLRQASSFQSVAPNVLQFQIVANGTTYNVKYDCTQPDSLGSLYTRCARTQAVAPSQPPNPGATAGSMDIQHVANGGITTFCNTLGTGPSGSVFFVSNPTIANTDGSNLACDEAYENLVGPQLKIPSYVQMLVKVPASGDLAHGGLSHQTVLTTSAFLPNSDSGA